MLNTHCISLSLSPPSDAEAMRAKQAAANAKKAEQEAEALKAKAGGQIVKQKI